MATSKLGVHVNAVTDKSGMLAFMQEAQPVVGLIIDHGAARDFLLEAKQVSPRTLWVGRVYTQEQPLDDPLRRAQEEFDRLMASSFRDLVDVFQGYNEIAGYPYLPNAGSENVLNYLTFEDRLVDLLNAANENYGCGAWSVANPDLKWFGHPLMKQVIAKSHALLLHEYCAPTMYYPGSFTPTYNDPENYLTTGNFCLRYRKVLSILKPLKPRILITECGIDSMAHDNWTVPSPDPSKHYGWRTYTDVLGYLEQLSWYDRQLQHDPEIVGAAIYCYGTEDPQWNPFDIRGDMARVLARYVALSHDQPTQREVEAWLGAQMQAFVIPYNMGAAFDVYRKTVGGTPEGWEARSREIDLTYASGWTFRCQVYVSGTTQHVVYARVDSAGNPLTFGGQPTDWLSATQHFDRSN